MAGVLCVGVASARALPLQASAAPASPAAPAATGGAASTPPAQSKAFLWTVSSPTATVHLLGSVHVASKDAYPLDPRIEAAFRRAQTVVFEMPMDAAAQQQVGQSLARAGTYPAGDSIDRHVSREVLDLLQRRLKGAGASLDAVRSFRPWFVALVLTLGEVERLGYHPAFGIDVYFAGKAAGQKRILALETLHEQVALFAGMSETVQEQMLRESLTKLDGLGDLIRRAQALWRAGDADALDALLIAPMRRDYPEVHRRLFVDRNRRMAAAVDGYLRGTGESLVVVGSGHLTGPEGILALLRSRGHSPVQQ